MDRQFEVLWNNAPVGKAEVSAQGLYYSITCRVRPGKAQLTRIVLRWKDGWENLGIPVPEEDGLLLRKKVPIKRIGEGDWTFLLLPSASDPQSVLFPEPAQIAGIPGEAAMQPDAEETREPIIEDQPFNNLEKLENAHLEIRDGSCEAVFASVDLLQIQHQSDGTVIGAHDLPIDGSSLDAGTKPV